MACNISFTCGWWPCYYVVCSAVVLQLQYFSILLTAHVKECVLLCEGLQCSLRATNPWELHSLPSSGNLLMYVKQCYLSTSGPVSHHDSWHPTHSLIDYSNCLGCIVNCFEQNIHILQFKISVSVLFFSLVIHLFYNKILFYLHLRNWNSTMSLFGGGSDRKMEGERRELTLIILNIFFYII